MASAVQAAVQLASVDGGDGDVATSGGSEETGSGEGGGEEAIAGSVLGDGLWVGMGGREGKRVGRMQWMVYAHVCTRVPHI